MAEIYNWISLFAFISAGLGLVAAAYLYFAFGIRNIFEGLRYRGLYQVNDRNEVMFDLKEFEENMETEIMRESVKWQDFVIIQDFVICNSDELIW